MNTKTRLAAREFAENNNISVSKRTGFPGSSLHGHDFYELDILASDTVLTVINGEEMIMRCGAVSFMTPTDFHEYAYEEPFDLYNIQFTEDAVSERISAEVLRVTKRAFLPSKDEREKIFTLAELMQKTNSAEVLSRLLECILLILLENQKKSAPANPKYSSEMQRALSYLNSHFKENPPLSEIAALVALNERYFCAKFKEYTGKTYKEYLREVKLKYAKRLILATALSATEISERSGYSTQSHFNREFKNFYGISPLKLRKSEKRK